MIDNQLFNYKFLKTVWLIQLHAVMIYPCRVRLNLSPILAMPSLTNNNWYPEAILEVEENHSSNHINR
jgi:hypothetical protein